MNEEEVEGELTDVCTSCGRTILDADDMVAVEALRRRNREVVEWHIVLCSDCHWRPEYSAHLSLVVRQSEPSTA